MSRTVSASKASATPVDVPKTQQSLHQIGAFLQLTIARPVASETDGTVGKGTMVSFTLPPLDKSAVDTLLAIQRSSTILSNLKTTSNADGSHAGAFGTFKINDVESLLRVISDLYAGAEKVVVSNGSGLPSDIEGFRKYHASRLARLGAMEDDARAILTSPQHGGTTAYVDHLGSLFRQELITIGGKYMTIGPDFKMTIFDSSIIGDNYGQVEWMNTLLELAHSIVIQGEGVVIALQLDATKSILGCGACAIAVDQYNKAMGKGEYMAYVAYVAAQLRIDVNAQPAVSAPLPEYAKDSAGNSITTEARAQSDHSNTCSNCGKSVAPGITCSCKTRRHG